MKKNKEENDMAMVKRSDKVAFYGVTKDGTTTYHRMKQFTEISQSKNPVEYSRQYVDEDFEESDVIGYAPTVSVALDQHTDNPVHDDIAEIFDKEMTGDAAVRDVVIVDLTKAVTGKAGHFAARKRSFSVVPGDEGSDTDRYGYSAEFKSKSSPIEGTATSTDGWMTCTFTEAE